jgi:glucose-6-phosphate-specific signal transduction histidine kinase
MKTLGKKQALTVAREIFMGLNPVFHKWAGISLGEAMSKVPEANLEVKKSPVERKSLRRKLLRSVKEDVEKKMAGNITTEVIVLARFAYYNYLTL